MARFIALWMGTLLQLCHATIYTNDWAIKIRGDLESVNRIAEKYGFTNMGQVSAVKHEEGNYLHNYQTCIWKFHLLENWKYWTNLTVEPLMALLIFFLGLHQKLLISVCTVWSAVQG